jgi:hypothetical protein
MTDPLELDLTDLRRTWEARRAALRRILRRVDPRGMRRPARDPDERAWLAQRGETPFIEDEACARAAREYYARRYAQTREDHDDRSRTGS